MFNIQSIKQPCDYHGVDYGKDSSSKLVTSNNAAILKSVHLSTQIGPQSNTSKCHTNEDSCKSQITQTMLWKFRWFGHQPLESKQSLKRVKLCTLYRAQALARGGGNFTSRYASIARGDRTDAIALLRFCETIACNSTKMTILGSILCFSEKTRTVTPPIF